MKKNVMRVISLVLVAGMLFAFSSCTQKIQISFVDADGNVINPFASSVSTGTNNGGSSTGNSGSNSGSTTPTPTPTPSVETTAAPAGDNTGDNTGDNSGDNSGAQTGVMPSTTAEVVNFYANAANNTKTVDMPSYVKKEWQSIDNLNITGTSMVDNAIADVVGGFMTVEEEATEQVCEKGSDDSRRKFPEWELADISNVASATCTALDNGNYQIVIIMKDEDTPKKDQSFIGQVTHSVLYWEDIEETLQNDETVTKILKSYSGVHVNYKGYNITAEITPDGHFVSLDHTADVDIIIGEAKILIVTLKNKSAHMWNYCKYYNFQY